MNNVFNPAIGDRDADDLRQNSSALFPSESYVDFLQQAHIQKKIGAEVHYQECPDAPYNLFVKTGDVRFCLPYLWMRFKVSLQIWNTGCQNMAPSAGTSRKL